jgi:hypothetical protein
MKEHRHLAHDGADANQLALRLLPEERHGPAHHVGGPGGLLCHPGRCITRRPEIQAVFSQSTDTDFGIDLRSGDRLLDLVSKRGRDLSHHADPIDTGKFGLQSLQLLALYFSAP